MHLTSRYATKIAPAPLTLLLVALAFSFAANAQDPAQQKPSPEKPTTETSVPVPTPPQKKLGSELDDRSIIFHTDLITLTVTVTDTYGRYVSGLSKGAFSVFDNKQQQEITFFSDDDSPVSVSLIHISEPTRLLSISYAVFCLK